MARGFCAATATDRSMALVARLTKLFSIAQALVPCGDLDKLVRLLAPKLSRIVLSSWPANTAKVTLVRPYHPPLTPCQRLLVSSAVDEAVKVRLLRQFAGLD
jgi:hypothetical protein